MTCPYLCYTKTAAGWEFTGRDDKPVPLEVVDAFIKSVGGSGGYLIPPEYLREHHPELAKAVAAAAAADRALVTKAESGTGGSVPPRPEPEPRPEPKAFDPVSANPAQRGAPAPSAQEPRRPAFDPVTSRPPIRVPEPAPKPAAPWWPRHSHS